MMRHFLVAAALVTLAGTTLGGCSSEYLDRRETIAMWSGDAQQANLVTHAVHPSPPLSSIRWLTFDGERMEQAHARYRTGQVMPPETNLGAARGSSP